MKVVASLLSYPPHRFIGSELMTHSMLTALQRRGHDVLVTVREQVLDYSWGGIPVTADAAPEADLLIYHPDFPLAAETWQGKKVAICHNARTGVQVGLYNTRPNLVTVNSNVMSHELPHPRKLVVHPPVRIPTTPTTGSSIGLINLEATSKVGPFWDIVRALPDRTFVGVKGGYGKQSIPPGRRPRNVTILDQLPPDRMHEVWAQLRVLLVPSATESWSMVASEALAHGIPVIAHPLPGLRENLADVGLWADRDQPEQWVERITWLESCWDEYSQKARERAIEQAELASAELDSWCAALEAL
jgi:hypothetical protein